MAKKKASNSKAGAKTTAQKAKEARAMASGTKSIKFTNVQTYGNISKKDQKISKKDQKNMQAQNKILSIANKIDGKKTLGETVKLAPTGKRKKASSSFLSAKEYKAIVKKVDSDAYDLLVKKAKAVGLKGMDADIAIDKALKNVSNRMKNDRQRTASRGEAIVRREERKRRNTNLG
jgi:hypothetical protein